MRIGLMRHRVGIASRSLEVDNFGQQIETWGAAVEVWGRVEELEAEESQENEVTQQRAKIRVTIRYRDALTTLDRLEINGEQFSIVSIIKPKERERLLEIVAERLV